MMTHLPASAPPTSPLAVAGAVIAGKYRLDSILGYGGMGSVWAATHLGVGREVAIKVISSSYSRSADVRKRFDTEAKAVASLKSRHVVQVYDNGELEDGTPFIAMERLYGESLHTRVHRTGPISLPETAKIISQVCRALSKSHALGIVHRDIKPENIFLAQSDDDNDYIVKVLDFGIAKLSAEGQTSSTQTGTLLGTPLYMSPEQARGLKSIDHRTDIYSLGLVTYTMLTGNLAFSSESFGDLLLQICTAPLPVLSANARWLPTAVDAWFDRACARDPQNRFATTLELAEALATIAGNLPSTLRLSSDPVLSAAPLMRGQSSGQMRVDVPATASGLAGMPGIPGMPQPTGPGMVHGMGPGMGAPHGHGPSPPNLGSVAMAPTMGSSPGFVHGPGVMSPSGMMGPSGPSLIAPMTMSGARKSGPGAGLLIAVFVVVAALAAGGVFAAKYALHRGDGDTSAARGKPPPAATGLPSSAGAERTFIPPADSALTAAASASGSASGAASGSGAAPTVPSVATGVPIVPIIPVTPSNPNGNGHGHHGGAPPPPPPSTGKQPIDLGY